MCFIELVSAIFLKLCWETREIWHLKITRILYFSGRGLALKVKRGTHTKLGAVKCFMEIIQKYVQPFPAWENRSGSSKFAFQ